MSELEEWNANAPSRVAEWQRKAAGVRDAQAQIQVKASSRNGELGVTVDAAGHVRHIHLTAQALRLGEAQLAQLLIETIRRAETDAARQARDAARPITEDPRAAETLRTVREITGQASTVAEPRKRGMTDDEMDAYYLDRKSWLT